MEEPARIASAEQAAAATSELYALEQLYQARADPATKRHVARDIQRLRSALTRYAVRRHMRRVHDQHA